MLVKVMIMVMIKFLGWSMLMRHTPVAVWSLQGARGIYMLLK